MSLSSGIEWTSATWNPVTGCTSVSPGCDRCYARTFAERFRGVKGHPYEQGFDLKLWEERLQLPLSWKRPRRIFVNSMSDLFHSQIPDTFIHQVFDTMRQAHWHTFQILTKRAGRLQHFGPQLDWPKNVWMGVSIESNDFVKRANALRYGTPAHVIRFISAEPLLSALPSLDLTDVNWLIVGCESGAGHRPMQLDWVRQLRDRCMEHETKFFFKQMHDGKKRISLPELDGEIWAQYPEVSVA